MSSFPLISNDFISHLLAQTQNLYDFAFKCLQPVFTNIFQLLTLWKVYFPSFQKLSENLQNQNLTIDISNPTKVRNFYINTISICGSFEIIINQWVYAYETLYLFFICDIVITATVVNFGILTNFVI